MDSVQEINPLMEDTVLRSLDARPRRLMEDTVLILLEAGPRWLVEDTVLRSLDKRPRWRAILFSVCPWCLIAHCR